MVNTMKYFRKSVRTAAKALLLSLACLIFYIVIFFIKETVLRTVSFPKSTLGFRENSVKNSHKFDCKRTFPSKQVNINALLIFFLKKLIT